MYERSNKSISLHGIILRVNSIEMDQSLQESGSFLVTYASRQETLIPNLSYGQFSIILRYLELFCTN